MAELKRKREKAAGELKDVKQAKKAAERRCREMEAEREAIADDYESRLQQQVITTAVMGRNRAHGSRQRGFRKLAGRVVSGQVGFSISHGSGRAGPGEFHISRVGPVRPHPIRPTSSE